MIFFSLARQIRRQLKEKKRRLYTNCMAIIIFNLFLIKPYSMFPSIQPVPVSGHLKQKLNFWGALFQFSVNEVFRMKAEHFSFKKKVMASLQLGKQLQKALFCSGV